MNQVKQNSLEQRLAQLYSRINYERQSRATPRSFKLHNMKELLGRLKDPHLDFPVIHIAGTKGKGSVATMVGSILTAAGFRTGVYTSPHLESIHQRMAVDGNLISDDELLAILDDLHPHASEMDQLAELSQLRDLTFFELTTAAMYLHFSRCQVDKGIVEVGLGGRLDSTNVCQPQVCVITNISFDHTKQLGNTLQEIAGEKAGIIKPGIPVVSGAINPSAAKVIEEIAERNGSRLYVLDRDFFVDVAESGKGFTVRGEIEGREFRHTELQLTLLGAHQTTNAALAVIVTELLKSQGDDVPESAMRSGLKEAYLNGRTEILGERPTVIIDMAHNVASIAALVDSMKQLPNWKRPETKKRLILATSRDKDARGMLRLLIPHFDEVIFSLYQNNPRGKCPHELSEIAVSLRDQLNLATRFRVIENPQEAWQAVHEKNTPADVCCIAGSVFLVAELRRTVLEDLKATRLSGA